MVVRGPTVVSRKIKKITLTFEAKALWILARHRLCPTIRENVMSLIGAAMIGGLIDGYDFDIVEFLAWEMRD